MTRDKQDAAEPKSYAEVVERLTQVVDALEGGKLPLEDSLERFAEGVRLVKKGEQVLSEAEKRIELLLSEEGKVAPLELASSAPVRQRSTKGSTNDEDVSF